MDRMEICMIIIAILIVMGIIVCAFSIIPATTEISEVAAVVTHMDYSRATTKSSSYNQYIMAFESENANNVAKITADQYARYEVGDKVIIQITTKRCLLGYTFASYKLLEE